jgi:hypothetical protein
MTGIQTKELSQKDKVEEMKIKIEKIVQDIGRVNLEVQIPDH